MKYALILVAALIFAPNLHAQQNKLSKAEVAEGWELLFDGASTEQWRGYNHHSFPDHGWEVRDSQLVVTYSDGSEGGFGGDIVTRETYSNFELKLDYMLTDSANTGIFYLVTEFEGNPIWNLAPEFQILDNPVYNSIYGDWMDTHRTGDNYDMQASIDDYTLPNGQWNTARIIKKDKHVEHWLNGNLCVMYEIESIEWKKQKSNSKYKDMPMHALAKRGQIGLQDHGHEVFFRNIKIRRFK